MLDAKKRVLGPVSKRAPSQLACLTLSLFETLLALRKLLLLLRGVWSALQSARLQKPVDGMFRKSNFATSNLDVSIMVDHSSGASSHLSTASHAHKQSRWKGHGQWVSNIARFGLTGIPGTATGRRPRATPAAAAAAAGARARRRPA